MSDFNSSISALLPVRNGGEYLESLLPVILEMLERSDELIVVNDGSTDSTEDIIAKFEKLDCRITSVKTSGVGLVQSLNLGVTASKNAWIARFDVDDRYAEFRLREQRSRLNSEISVLFSDYKFFSSSGVGLGMVYSAVFPNPTAISLVASQRTAHPSAVINREKLLLAGGYLEEDFPAEDLGLWLRMANYGQIVSVPHLLLHYRINANSISSNNRKVQMSKSRDLSNRTRIWHALYIQAQLEFVQIVREYLSLPGGSERIFLHIRELRILEKRLSLKSSYLPRLLKIGVVPTAKVVFSGVRILYFVLIRRIYRFS